GVLLVALPPPAVRAGGYGIYRYGCTGRHPRHALPRAGCRRSPPGPPPPPGAPEPRHERRRHPDELGLLRPRLPAGHRRLGAGATPRAGADMAGASPVRVVRRPGLGPGDT